MLQPYCGDYLGSDRGNFMRSFYTVLLILLIFLMLTACAPVQKDGIDNYEKYTCSVGLTSNLFPSDDFLALFPFKNSDYHYWDSDDWIWGYVKTFSYLTYDAEIYAAAKEYCLENFSLSEGHSYAYNEYCFIENVCYEVKDESNEWGVESTFPRHFNMFGYHDESCTLFFFGYYNGAPRSEEKELALDDFSAFMKTVYKEYYDFDK